MLLTHDKDLKDIMRYAMDAHGFHMLFPANGNDVLTLLKPDNIDYVIIDHNMPVTNSLELVKRFRKQYPAAIIIALGDEDRGMEFLRGGANDFLKKPFIPYRLVMMLDGGDIEPHA